MRTPVLALLVAGMAGGVAPIESWADFDPTTDGSKFKTWAWHPGPDTPLPEGGVREENLRRIKHAIAEAIFARGAKLAPIEQADVLVAFHAMVGGMEDERARRIQFGYDWTGSAPAPSGRQVGEGTLVIDVIANTKPPRLVWHGVAAGAVTRGLSPEETVARIEEAVAAIAAQYPPGRGR
jgi:hypothetical protein